MVIIVKIRGPHGNINFNDFTNQLQIILYHRISNPIGSYCSDSKILLVRRQSTLVTCQSLKHWKIYKITTQANSNSCTIACLSQYYGPFGDHFKFFYTHTNPLERGYKLSGGCGMHSSNIRCGKVLSSKGNSKLRNPIFFCFFSNKSFYFLTSRKKRPTKDKTMMQFQRTCQVSRRAFGTDTRVVTSLMADVHGTTHGKKMWRNKPLFRREGDKRFRTGNEAAVML